MLVLPQGRDTLGTHVAIVCTDRQRQEPVFVRRGLSRDLVPFGSGSATQRTRRPIPIEGDLVRVRGFHPRGDHGAQSETGRAGWHAVPMLRGTRSDPNL